MFKFRKLLRPRNLVIFLFLAAFSISILIPMGAALTDDEGYRSYSGTPRIVSSVSSRLGLPMKMIANNTGKDYFIPVKTADEWNRFLAAAPGLGMTVISDFCGNGTCGTDMTNPSLPRVESYSWCPSDCSAPSLYCGDGSCNNGEDCYSCSSDCGACYCNFVSDCPGYPGDITVSYTCDNSIGYCIDAYPWVECIPIPPELEGTCSFNQCWHSDQTGTCTKHLTPVWY